METTYIFWLQITLCVALIMAIIDIFRRIQSGDSRINLALGTVLTVIGTTLFIVRLFSDTVSVVSGFMPLILGSFIGASFSLLLMAVRRIREIRKVFYKKNYLRNTNAVIKKMKALYPHFACDRDSVSLYKVSDHNYTWVVKHCVHGNEDTRTFYLDGSIAPNGKITVEQAHHGETISPKKGFDAKMSWTLEKGYRIHPNWKM